MLEFAVAAAESSGRIARRYFRSTLEVKSKSEFEHDPFTEADLGIERFLRRKIRDSYPRHGVIGEEHGSEAGDDYTWIIDPIDGTRGFISGSPMWGTLLGLTRKGKPVLGLMHQPLLKETFYADRAGAWLKRGGELRPLRTRRTVELCNAILYCTHPGMFDSDADRRSYRRVEQHCRYSRYGADCYGYCLLAAGFVDLVIEGGLKSYDILPLVPLIEAAGGVVTDWEGNAPPAGGRVVAAAGRKLHREAMELLCEA